MLLTLIRVYVFVYIKGEAESKYVSLACRCWPNIECMLGSFVILGDPKQHFSLFAREKPVFGVYDLVMINQPAHHPHSIGRS